MIMKIMKKKYLSLVFLGIGVIALVLSGCGENVLPEPDEGVVQYYFEGKVNGNLVKWEAGKNGYYLSLNEVPPVFNPDMVFFGKLRIPNDSTRNALEIYIEKPELFVPASVDTLFQVGAFSYSSPSTTLSENLTFQADFQGNPSAVTYTWDFGDGTFSNIPNPIHTFPNPNQEYAVKLSSTITDNQFPCRSEIVQKIIPTNILCRENFSFMPTGGLQREIAFQSSSSLKWDFGDGSPIVIGTNPIHLYSSKGVFTVSTQSEASSSCPYQMSKNIQVGEIGGCGVNFEVSSPTLPENKVIRIVYRDDSGKAYHSDRTSQAVGAYFSLTQVENKIENQQKIKKINVKFSCTLQSTDGEVLNIMSENTSFGMRVP